MTRTARAPVMNRPNEPPPPLGRAAGGGRGGGDDDDDDSNVSSETVGSLSMVDPNKRKIAIDAGQVEAIADHELIRDGETHIVDIYGGLGVFGLV